MLAEEPNCYNVCLATAGHVDHGKSSLVKALCGHDPDQLAEEKRRHMTIDLGFEQLQFENGKSCALIDIPGHNDFIRRAAGALFSADIVLLCISAKEGLKPQTYDHMHICKLLGISCVVVCFTFASCVQNNELADVYEHTQKLCKTMGFADVSYIACDTKTGFGIEQLRSLLQQKVALVSQKPYTNTCACTSYFFIDRHFVLPGKGHIVAGTLEGNKLCRADMLYASEHAHQAVRIRNMRVYHDVACAYPKQRVALQISTSNSDSLTRGTILTTSADVKPSQTCIAQCKLLSGASAKALHNKRVHIQLGPKHVCARLRFLQGSYMLIHLEKPSVLPNTSTCLLFDWSSLKLLGSATIVMQKAPNRIADARVAIHPDAQSLKAHNKDKKPEKKTTAIASKDLERLDAFVRAHCFAPIEIAQFIQDYPCDMSYAVALFHRLVQENQLIQLSREIYVTPQTYNASMQVLTDFKDRPFTVSQARCHLGFSRKHTLALLKYTDAQHITKRLTDDPSKRSFVRYNKSRGE